MFTKEILVHYLMCFSFSSQTEIDSSSKKKRVTSASEYFAALRWSVQVTAVMLKLRAPTPQALR